MTNPHFCAVWKYDFNIFCAVLARNNRNFVQFIKNICIFAVKETYHEFTANTYRPTRRDNKH